MSHSALISWDSMESMQHITKCYGELLSFYLFKLHEHWILSFLQIVYFIQLNICRPTCIDKVVKTVYLSGDLTVGILNLNDDMIEYWNYVQPITVQETKSIFCAYWHKYCTDFGIGIAIVKPVTQKKAYNKRKFHMSHSLLNSIMFVFIHNPPIIIHDILSLYLTFGSIKLSSCPVSVTY